MIGHIVAYKNPVDQHLPVGQWIIVRQFNEDLDLANTNYKDVLVSLHGIEMTGILIGDSVYVY